MGQIATVISTERVTGDDGNPIVEVRCDAGAGPITAELLQPSGDDSLPLPGDFVALVEGPGQGTQLAVATCDGKNTGTSAAGERRLYARKNADGTIVSDLWLKGDGTIAIRGLVNGGSATLDPSDGSWNLNGVKIDKQGNLTAPGEITAKAATPATAVKLSTHLHPTGTGPSGSPQPGT